MPDSDEDFASYVAARYPRLVRSAVLLGAPRSDAEDVVQSALVRCYRSWTSVVSAHDPDAYVYRVLANSLAKSRRRRWWGETPTEVLPDGGEQHRDHAGDVATSVTLRRALLAMSYDQRAVLVLRYFADLSEQQAAAALGIPVGTVKSRTARALTALARDPSVSRLPSAEENHAG